MRSARLWLRCLPPRAPTPLLLWLRGWATAGRRSPEPHLPPDAAIAPDDGPGDVDCAPVPRLEGGGAGGGAGREIVKYAHMEIGMCRVEHVTRVFVMMRLFVREESVHRIHERVVEWIIEWIMAGKECSKEVKWI